MGLFKSLRGNHPKYVGGPQPETESKKNHAEGKVPQSGSSEHVYASPPSPPPSLNTYTMPPRASDTHSHFAPPPGPPPSIGEPPPYHDWTVIPDTSTLPPPPTTGHEQPFRNNADKWEADRAHAWCKANPLLYPHQPTPEQHSAVNTGQVPLIRPHEYRGDLHMLTPGLWNASTRSGMKDACLLTSFPLYFAEADSPIRTGRNKTIYYEVEILSLGSVASNDESTVALGYCGLPYPTWRLPGWERASLGVHSDDGHRYVNDTWGGKDFTQPFKAGDTVGIGMTFSVPDSPPEYNVQQTHSFSKNNVEVFFTRNGVKENGWNVHEELDHDLDQGIDGLDGLFDLYGAIGSFGVASFAVKFRRQEWLWRPL